MKYKKVERANGYVEVWTQFLRADWEPCKASQTTAARSLLMRPPVNMCGRLFPVMRSCVKKSSRSNNRPPDSSAYILTVSGGGGIITFKAR